MSRIVGLLLLAAVPGAASAQDWTRPPVVIGGDGFGGQEVTSPGLGGQGIGDGFGAPVATVPAPVQAGAPAFSLFQGSEASLALGYWAGGPDGDFSALGLDTRHTLWVAPFLGTQLDLGAGRIDGETAFVAGVHLHLMPETGDRFGVFWLPAWDGGLDERVDNYGLEGIFGAVPNLTIEARIGRFDGDAASGPYFGARGFYAFGPQVAMTAGFQHTRLDVDGDDLTATDALVGAEYFLPGTDLRLSGGVGLARFAGDTPTTTDLRFEVGATLFAFGQPASTARLRTFGRQTFIGGF